jgi:malonyl-CoA O-methyltransferase
MLERLDLLKAKPQRILDLGSGTGYCARRLRRRYPDSTVVEVDVTLPMLQKSRMLEPWWRRGLDALHVVSARLLCADMEHLPVASGCFDMVWSNMALHWAIDTTRVFDEITRVLRPGGVCMFSTLGPDTLKELRSAYARADHCAHVNDFLDMHDLGDMLVGSGLADPVMDMECITATYPDLRRLLAEIKATGTVNLSADRNPSLSGRRTFDVCEQVYEGLRIDGRLPATFEVVYGQAWKAQHRGKRADAQSVVPRIEQWHHSSRAVYS